ncbi:MAG TPA: nitroreductase/quinone reductase family protein, partial [Acidimicrobiales bacterium]|nr:nitroreductase/quinone reductase family protein [Acidimicrobiales bacterium]
MPTKRTMRDRWNKWFGAGHRAVLRASGGRVGRRIGKAPILLLTTTGRRSGQARTVPLMYWSDGDRFAIVASNAGQDHAPAWYGNLLAQPAVEIELLGERMAATARTAS